VSSTNHKPGTPSWLSDNGGTAWASDRAPSAPAADPTGDSTGSSTGSSTGADPAAAPQRPEVRTDPAEARPDGTAPPALGRSAATTAPDATTARTPAPARPSGPPPGPPPGPPAGPPARPRTAGPEVPADPAPPQPAPDPSRPTWTDGDGVLTNLVQVRRSPPKEGWRAMVYRASGGRWNPGLSESEARLREQLQKIRLPLPGPHSVVVGSIKGGIGKTTVSSLLGLALAEHRGDRVIAVDANPDAGTLGDRLVGEEAASRTTVRDLLDNIERVRSSTQLAGYTHLAGRLQVLTSEQEPELSEMFSATDYESVLRLLARFHEAIITDSGTGVVHSAMQGSLRHADSLVIVGAPTQDGASRASRTLQWLAMHGYRELAEDAVVVLSCDRHSPYVDDSIVRDHFRARCRAVIELPADQHLATGGLIDLEALQPATRDATLQLAATVAEGFHASRTRGLASHGFRAEGPR
jgi:MinD-like ATPase involved in chromosome partitioning or flagellar assembly